MDFAANDLILNLLKAEIEYQYYEKYRLSSEISFTERWTFHFTKTKNMEEDVPEDPFLHGLTRMLVYHDVDKRLHDLYILLAHAIYDAKDPFRPIWGFSTFTSSPENTQSPIRFKFVTVREAILSNDVYQQFTDTLEPYGFKAILLASSILLPDCNLIGCVWVHPEGSNQGYLVSKVKEIKYLSPYESS